MTVLYMIAGLAILPLVVWGFYAQSRVREVFEKYSKRPVKKGITGSRLARGMLNAAGLHDIVIEEVRSELGDHYDPRHKVIRLSRSVSRGSSVAAVGIAAHEASHAIQDASGYQPVRLRNSIAPIVEKAGYVIFPLLFFGLVLGSILVTSLFINVAVFLFLGIVIFYLVTLPVEWNASSRALQYLKEKEVLDDKELAGVREVLKAAVLTYIIAATLVVMQFLRLLGLYRSR